MPFQYQAINSKLFYGSVACIAVLPLGFPCRQWPGGKLRYAVHRDRRATSFYNSPPIIETLLVVHSCVTHTVANPMELVRLGAIADLCPTHAHLALGKYVEFLEWGEEGAAEGLMKRMTCVCSLRASCRRNKMPSFLSAAAASTLKLAHTVSGSITPAYLLRVLKVTVGVDEEFKSQL